MMLRLALVIVAFASCVFLSAINLLPVWPYDWEPPAGAAADSDARLFDILCASAASVMAALAAMLGRAFTRPRSRRIAYAAAAVLLLLNLTRIAMLLFSARPWPDFS